MPEKTLEELVDASSLIFKGTVRTIGASMMPEIPASDEMAVVTIDSVLASAPVLGNLEGSALTIRLSGAETIKPRDQAIFFTNVWIYGAQLAVAEVGRAGSKTEGNVTAAIAKRPDRKLAARLNGAELVVVGDVQKVEEATDVVEPVSDHSPEWKRATLRVESVEFGEFTKHQVEVLFASSDEPVFESAPKLEEGQQGLFVLRRGEGPFAPPEAFTLLDPLDVLPRAALSRVRELLKTRISR